jgi:transcriptional regulator with XRE-family HTH domain
MSSEVAIARLVDLLTERRKREGMSREKLAKMLGVTRSAVRKWEMHEREPTFATLDQWADVHGCDLVVMLSDRTDGLSREKRELLARAAHAIAQLPFERATTAVDFLVFQAQTKGPEAPANE